MMQMNNAGGRAMQKNEEKQRKKCEELAILEDERKGDENFNFQHVITSSTV